MEKLNAETARLTDEYSIRIGRWSQYAITEQLPFDAMWCVIPPGGSSQRDCHDEVELAVVVGGNADFEHAEDTPGAAERTEAAQGTAMLLGSNEPHIVHNRSTTEPLVVLSVYWPQQAPAPAASAGTEAGS
ncbi:cupin domain-containing protein [Streptomyces sporangiiformans]|uniref:Cupin domain-containing protein n=1 Tax=Streptomyces sporangiiformans TaxID=2315329 RepID=A0A505D2D0_9ACTN|nr:cupin domain-containing protein [Streptomyces sporangiiformans]TPQ18613.1 cupin domain-containing protein [Streptomyces sporangiiformans]